ncbi:acyltransferase [Pontibacter sp. HSC-36F09]|uniref:acyltransferase family protein n=1 Tax=Pontibacter sp. HSC-36F09 TaxID=2910966 RepID=UPI0020A1A09E|nr:acyltransferase [Pontibacter sp. HSC-36F09]MCP2042622.1 peptidoglycan/LPS O-acetylase OafA/YrhL [Pontibacter sp. HSC-36F09]
MSVALQEKGSFFNSLQIFRGIAALMVVFHHQWPSFTYFFGLDNSTISFVAGLGKHGVDFFFVLSGFIITYSCYNKSASFETNKSYLLNRVFRIYIPYLPIGIAMLLLYSLLPNMSEGNRDISLLTSLTLIPDGPPALSVAWTLVHEMIFYLLFLIWFYTKRGWYIFTAVWAGVIIYLNWLHAGTAWDGIPVLKFFASVYNLEFIMGFYLAVLVKETKLAGQQAFLAVAALVCTAAVILKWQGVQLPITLVFAVSFFFLILGSINTALDRIKSSSLLMAVGNASYSIYLVHNPEISILVRLFPKYSGELYSAFVFVAVFIICCLSGVIYSKIFEEYLLKKAKGKFLPARAKASTNMAVAESKN